MQPFQCWTLLASDFARIVIVQIMMHGLMDVLDQFNLLVLRDCQAKRL